MNNHSIKWYLYFSFDNLKKTIKNLFYFKELNQCVVQTEQTSNDLKTSSASFVSFRPIIAF